VYAVEDVRALVGQRLCYLWYMNSDRILLSRRAVLTDGVVLAAGAALMSRPLPAKEKLQVAIFSKHLQFLTGEALAKAVVELGFDGVDITVRKGGHVEPARVAQDLPALAAICKQHGLEIPMITTDIVDAETPFAEDILKTMAGLGIRNYRFGAFKWTADQSYAAQLDAMRPRLAKLAALNARYQACAMYHTHSGVGLVGAGIWDLHILMKDLDPKAVGVNYDVGHATIEGGLGGWIASFKITGPHLRGIAVKDFLWVPDAKGNWREQWKPIGEGMVRFPQFFGMVAEAGFSGPLQIHYEYPLGGANNGATKITIPREEVFGAMKKDLVKVHGYLAQAGV
jgi:sugar phosphate isomerase/epimerase